MLGVRPKQLSRMGQFYLEEAILDVLLQAACEEDCIGAAEISRRAGIFRESSGGEPIAAMNDAIATGMLIRLYRDGKVEKCKQSGGRGGWKLTDEELERRRDDVSNN